MCLLFSSFMKGVVEYCCVPPTTSLSPQVVSAAQFWLSLCDLSCCEMNPASHDHSACHHCHVHAECTKAFLMNAAQRGPPLQYFHRTTYSYFMAIYFICINILSVSILYTLTSRSLYPTGTVMQTRVAAGVRRKQQKQHPLSLIIQSGKIPLTC